MGNLKIITDSGSDIKKDVAERLGIRVIPISYSFDGETYYLDGVDLSPDEFYKKLRESDIIPKTTQVTPTQYEDVFNEEYDKGNDELIVVTISSNGSGMYQNAVLTARQVMEERGGDITVIDSKGFTCLYGAPVIHAAKMIKDNKPKEEVISCLKDMLSSMHSYFAVGDLAHLKKGGRINAATLVIANMLDIKPVLTVDGGLVVQKDKLRGSKRIWKKLVAKSIEDGCDFKNSSVIIVNTAQEQKAAELKGELEAAYDGINALKCDIGVIVGSHGGPDLVGFVYSDKYKLDDYED